MSEYLSSGQETSQNLYISNSGPGGLNYSLNVLQLLGRGTVFENRRDGSTPRISMISSM
jgi:hypothetical protein